MIGLAVGIDYTLFIVERFREERAKGVEKVEAIVRAGDTASRAVLFSGITVIIALAGMFIVPANDVQGHGDRRDLRRHRRRRDRADAAAGGAQPARRQDQLAAPPGTRRRQVTHERRGRLLRRRRRPLVIKHPCIAVVGHARHPGRRGDPVPHDRPRLARHRRRCRSDLESGQAFRVLDEKFSAGRIGPAYVLIEGDVQLARSAGRDRAARARRSQSDTDFGGVRRARVQRGRHDRGMSTSS